MLDVCAIVVDGTYKISACVCVCVYRSINRRNLIIICSTEMIVSCMTMTQKILYYILCCISPHCLAIHYYLLELFVERREKNNL